MWIVSILLVIYNFLFADYLLLLPILLINKGCHRKTNKDFYQILNYLCFVIAFLDSDWDTTRLKKYTILDWLMIDFELGNEMRGWMSKLPSDLSNK